MQSAGQDPNAWVKCRGFILFFLKKGEHTTTGIHKGGKTLTRGSGVPQEAAVKEAVQA